MNSNFACLSTCHCCDLLSVQFGICNFCDARSPGDADGCNDVVDSCDNLGDVNDAVGDDDDDNVFSSTSDERRQLEPTHTTVFFSSPSSHCQCASENLPHPSLCSDHAVRDSSRSDSQVDRVRGVSSSVMVSCSDESSVVRVEGPQSHDQC